MSRVTQFVYIFIVVISVMVTSCGSVEQLLRPSTTEILIENTCDTPCFYGIMPGETSSQEAFLLLVDVPRVQPETISTRGSGVGYPAKYRAKLTNGYYCEIELTNYVATAINITGRYYLRDLITLYGEPDNVMLAPSYGHPQVLYLYNNQFIYFISDSSIPNAQFIDLEPMSLIDIVVYVAPTKFDDNLELFYNAYEKGRANPIESFMQPWKGYGKVEVIPWW